MSKRKRKKESYCGEEMLLDVKKIKVESQEDSLYTDNHVKDSANVREKERHKKKKKHKHQQQQQQQQQLQQQQEYKQRKHKHRKHKHRKHRQQQDVTETHQRVIEPEEIFHQSSHLKVREKIMEGIRTSDPQTTVCLDDKYGELHSESFKNQIASMLCSSTSP